MERCSRSHLSGSRTLVAYRFLAFPAAVPVVEESEFRLFASAKPSHEGEQGGREGKGREEEGGERRD